MSFFIGENDNIFVMYLSMVHLVLYAKTSEPNGDGKYGIMAAFKVEGNLDELHTHA